MRLFLLVICFGFLIGCSTFSTQLSNDQEFAKSVFLNEPVPEIYGGTRLNFEMASQIPDAGQAALFGLIFVVIDTPLSLIGDTLLLPYTLTRPEKQALETNE